MAEFFFKIIGALLGIFVVFMISPFLTTLMTGTIFFGFDGMSNAVSWLWDTHWALPGIAVFALFAIGAIGFFGVLFAIVGIIIGMIKAILS
jgi:hypothetical protein